ncbi:kinase-like domain-containing protein [Glomus cerebriforme]|uniref:Kinase-like domain-containing protein n=1 Tax=Glomus cerebriforme TaxID=658196 RepID=A0A397SJI8_9GLOM|nr:kinase-like domain-containing protein [Glomus cerebriforme]
MLSDILCGLENVHGANIIHKDFHSGNIFIKNQPGSAVSVVIGDFGISKSALEDDDNEIYGIIPYVAPEVLQGQKYTKASDIYGFGMIMWELMTGRRPFWDKPHDTDLILEICDGLRPPIVTNAPKGYIKLMKECCHSDPNKRPTVINITLKVSLMLLGDKYNSVKITKSSDIGPITTNNPGAIYKSRSLSAMIKSAESTRNLKTQSSLYYDPSNTKEGKRKFDSKLIGDIEDDVKDKGIKKIKLSKNKDYLTRELEFDIVKDINSSNTNNHCK